MYDLPRGGGMERRLLYQWEDNSGCNHAFSGPQRQIRNRLVGRCDTCGREVATGVGQDAGRSWLVQYGPSTGSYIVMAISCSHCHYRQIVDVRARTDAAHVGGQTVRCLKCKRDFKVTLPDAIVGGPYPDTH